MLFKSVMKAISLYPPWYQNQFLGNRSSSKNNNKDYNKKLTVNGTLPTCHTQ